MMVIRYRPRVDRCATRHGPTAVLPGASRTLPTVATGNLGAEVAGISRTPTAVATPAGRHHVLDHIGATITDRDHMVNRRFLRMATRQQVADLAATPGAAVHAMEHLGAGFPMSSSPSFALTHVPSHGGS